MRIYVRLTDRAWFSRLRQLAPAEASFWQIDTRQFHAIAPGELFLFKLHSPENYIVGGGVFAEQHLLPASLAWSAFGPTSGADDFPSFLQQIHRQRGTNRQDEPDPEISVLVLVQPFFLEEDDWIPVPADWAPQTAQGRIYDTTSSPGRELYAQVRQTLIRRRLRKRRYFRRFQAPAITAADFSLGMLNVRVFDTYHRRCAITGAAALPVLQAIQIQPSSAGGPLMISNGLVLRQDLGTLFQQGYLTISDERLVQVSPRLEADLAGAGHYAALHGQRLVTLPDSLLEWPGRERLRWHRENVYLQG
jgi:putative restriction endonuclease